MSNPPPAVQSFALCRPKKLFDSYSIGHIQEGGQLAVKGEPENRAILSTPAAPIRVRKPRTRIPRSTASLKLRILIVDDLLEVRMMLKGILSAMGHVIHEAEDGVAAIDLIRSKQYSDQTHFHLVFMDFDMPRQNGASAITEIRSMPEILQPKIIGFSSEPSYNDALRSVGADRSLQKSATREEIHANISELFSAEY